MALPVPVAPMAPEPPDPDVSTPVKVTTVMEAGTLRASLATTETFVTVAGANARQISAVPSCALVRLTSDHVKPAPVTLVTVILDALASVAIKASSNSFALAVEKLGDVMLEPEVPRSFETVLSIASCADGFTVRPAVLELDRYVAVTVTAVDVVTTEVVAVNVAEVAPAATVTEAGSVAALELSLRVTLAPPVGAGPLSVTVPVELVPPTTVAGLKLNAESVGGVTVRLAVLELDR